MYRHKIYPKSNKIFSLYIVRSEIVTFKCIRAFEIAKEIVSLQFTIYNVHVLLS